MIREEQYKCLEPESAALKHLDFLPWAPDYGNNNDFFTQKCDDSMFTIQKFSALDT